MQHNQHSSGLTASGVALGCHSRCTFHHKPDPSGIIALIRRAIDSGVSLIDCASGPSTELIVRKAIARQDIPVTLCVRSPSRSVRKECENSLRRLGVDRIDLYYLSPVAGRSIEHLVIAAAQLIEAGKIAHIGLSDVTADQLRQAQAIHPIAALVTEYSLLARQIERTQLAAAREAGMAVIACRPLAGGRLTGRLAGAGEARYRDRLRHDRHIPPAQAAGTASQILVAEQTAADLDLGLSRLALAWLLAQGPDIIPVAGTCDQVHLEMNLAAAAVRLPAESLARLSAPTPLSAD
jgi:aryl-alcohol dehydrogenase-like predicted oxidoreductase